NRCVCKTQPRLTLAPAPSSTRSASGSQYVSHQTPAPILAPSVRSQPVSNGVPGTEPANHGTARVSKKASASSLRPTNELHNGCSTRVNLPTNVHLATVATPAAIRPATNSSTPPPSAAAHQPSAPTSASNPANTSTASAAEHITGITRQ